MKSQGSALRDYADVREDMVIAAPTELTHYLTRASGMHDITDIFLLMGVDFQLDVSMNLPHSCPIYHICSLYSKTTSTMFQFEIDWMYYSTIFSKQLKHCQL